jgi:hypothetical protein
MGKAINRTCRKEARRERGGSRCVFRALLSCWCCNFHVLTVRRGVRIIQSRSFLALIIASRMHRIFLGHGLQDCGCQNLQGRLWRWTAASLPDCRDLTRRLPPPTPQTRLKTSSHDHGIGLTRNKTCSSRPSKRRDTAPPNAPPRLYDAALRVHS